MSNRLLAGALVFVCLAIAQRRVYPKNSYNRVIAVTPLVGAGTATDPKRPKYAPWPPSQDPNGAALLPILSDKSLTQFEKGRSSRSDIETALKRFRRSEE